jgi:hypothetical protein
MQHATQSPHPPRPRIIGIGLNKTGTTTLAAAGAQLGWTRQVSCRRDLLARYRGGDAACVLEAVAAHDLCEDWPWPLAFREILAHFGDSCRYVLTMRATPDIWLQSLKAHAERVSPTMHCRLLAYGHAYPHGREREHLDFYQRHADAVRMHFANLGASHLLWEACWEAGDGWDGLSQFLGVAAPSTPFPHENRAPLHPDPAMLAANRQQISIQRSLLALEDMPRLDG